MLIFCPCNINEIVLTILFTQTKCMVSNIYLCLHNVKDIYQLLVLTATMLLCSHAALVSLKYIWLCVFFTSTKIILTVIVKDENVILSLFYPISGNIILKHQSVVCFALNANSCVC